MAKKKGSSSKFALAEPKESKKDLQKVCLFKFFIVLREPIEFEGVTYKCPVTKEGVVKGNPRIYMYSHEDTKAERDKWTGKEKIPIATIYQMKGAIDILSFLERLDEAHPNIVKQFVVYANTYRPNPDKPKFTPSVLAEWNPQSR